jgi:maleate isomerase
MKSAASSGAAYGWRARIGFVTPSPGIENNAYEFYRMVPSGVVAVLTSLGVLGLSQDQYDMGLSRLPFALEEMTRRGVDVIVQAGVPLVVTQGWGYEARLLQEIRKHTAIPAVTDIGASLAAMQALGMTRVAMLSPFADELEAQITDYVRTAGIQVIAIASLLDTVAFDEISRVPLASVYRAAKQLAASAGGTIEGVWITGAYMPSVGIIESLEADLNRPVVTAMQAMTWAALQRAGVRDTIQGFGQLFSHRLPEERDL